VLSDEFTVSGRAMLEAIIVGERDPERLADLAQGTARRKREGHIDALRGRITTHHRGLLKLHLGDRRSRTRSGRARCGRWKKLRADPPVRPLADHNAGDQ